MKERILIKDLIGIEELAGTPQGIAQRAKKENWRRRRVTGVKGNVFEYYVGDMPASVQQALGFTVRLPENPSQARDDFIVKTPSGGEFGLELKARRLKGGISSVSALQHAIALIEEAVTHIGEEPANHLNNIEWHLVSCFRASSEEGRVAILSTAESMASLKEKKDEDKLLEDNLNVA